MKTEEIIERLRNPQKYNKVVLAQQQKEFELRESMEKIVLDDSFFNDLPTALTYEARVKILAVRPHTIGDLAHIPGVRASDVAVTAMTIRKRMRNDKNQ